MEELRPPTTLSHYRIVSKLGAGGMGEVYLAQDTKLDRRVALKILPADVASQRDRMERFVREAKSAAALNHPNIAHVYEIGESEGTHFIAMEFIDGDTLRHKIHKDRAPLSKLLEYLIQVAQGLSKAHAAGIVHRDLKPDNIMITRDDYAKVLDFGLAKLVERGGEVETGRRGEEVPTIAFSPRPPVSPSLSTPGIVLGTVGYMSPEQASGRVDEIDLRSDIFSFGCILFEAATGQRAFAGKDVLDSLHKIVHAPTPQLKDANPLAPADLQRVVRRCLAKEREKRYQSIKELVIELDDLQQELKGFPELQYSGQPAPAPSGSTSGRTRGDEGFRIAVLPFKVRDADPAVGVLADGLSEEIVTGLSRFRYLSVVTSASAARLTGETKAERAPGANLGTRYMLDGSIRKAGFAIRVSAQLVDTETGAQLWSETYNRDLQTSTIFGVQDDVAARIVATAADSYGVLVHSMRDAIRQKDDADLTSAEWQFQYFAYREQITPSNHAALKMRLDRAAKSDNRPSDLWACLAQVYLDEYAFGFPGDDGTSLDRALVAARRAVELDRANQFAMVALAQTHFFRQDLAAFSPAAERAMALNPLNTDALGILGLQIVHTGEFERGTTIVRRAMELNPNHAGWMHFAPLWDHFHKGEYEQALECANRVDVPGLFWPYLVMASACGHLGRRTEAEAAVRDLLALDPEFAKHARSNVGTWHFASGLMDPILEGLRKAGLDISDEEPAPKSSALASETRADEGFWVAVLPFKYTGSNTEVATLAEGLSEEIVTGLSRFSYLSVISRSSTLRYASETSDVRTVGKTLGARYVMEGSLRLAGSMLRVAVQLVDASTGAHLWAETYDRPFREQDIFALQDDLVPRIVSTVADQYGALVHSMSESLRGRSAGQYSAHEAVLRAFGYWERMTPEEHAEVRDILEGAVAVAPDHSDCLAELAFIYWHEYAFGYNLRPDPLGRARAAAQRAVASAPTSHFAHCALATGMFFQKDYLAFRPAAERALALNRMDSSTAAILGNMIAYAGDWEYGLGIVERAMQLNPHHAGWYHYVAFCDAYRRRNYRGALASALKVNMPAYHWPHVYLAAVYGQLGEQARARAALRELDALVPDFGARAREELGKWLDAELTEHLIDGLRKAGLKIPEAGRTVLTPPDSKTATTSIPASGETRSSEGFWIAVLPFKSTGTNVGVNTLAEGLSEEIVTGLSRFSYLRVIARSSTLRYASSTGDVRTVGQELGARYVIEGSLRQAGPKLRLAVQLVDAMTGAHLWAETYDREFRTEEVFALQDDLVPRIVSTVADVNGVLPRSMCEAVCSRSPGELSPYEAVLRSFRYFDRVSPEELAAARSCLEIAVEKAPSYGDAWAMLALLCVQDYAQGFNLQSDSLKQGRTAAQRAVEAAPSNHLAYFSLAQAHFFQKELQSFRNAAERAVALNPMDGNSLAFVGELLTYVDDSERGLSLAARAKQINPNHPGWFWYADFFHAYRQGDYSGALSLVLKANLPGHWGMHAGIAACAGQLGDRETATKAIRDLLKLQPDFCATVHDTFAKWFDPELRGLLIDGLRKAGLEINSENGATHTSSVASTTSPPSSIAFEGRPAIAVLPFENLSNDPEQEYFADGLADDLITRLSLWRSFPVIARNSSFVYKGKAVDHKKVSAELGVRYVVQGSVRKANNQVRISAQLIDATTAQHAWAKTYDRELTDVFAVQDEISQAIAISLVGDLERAEHSRVQRRAPESLEAWGLYQRALPLIYNFTREDCAQARTLLERAVKHDPHFSTALSRLAEVGIWETMYEWSDDPKVTLDNAVAEARRAVALDPLDAQAHVSLSFALMTAGDHGALEEARQAVELNPSMPFALAVHAYQRHMAGHSPEESIGFVQRALRLSPHDPVEWLFYDVLASAYLNAGRFAEGLEAGQRLIALSPNYYWGYLWSAMNAVGLGQSAQARKLLHEALRVKPELSFELARKCLGTMAPDVERRFTAALRNAGLKQAETGRQGDGETGGWGETGRSFSSSNSRDSLGSLIKTIAVLPFQNLSGDPEQEYLADGITEEILNALAQIPGLRVAGRSSAFSFKGRNEDLRTVGAKLRVATILEGTLRRSGDRLRITAQLIDAESGYQLWSERYDRVMEDVFAVQDEIANTIAGRLQLSLSADEVEPAQPPTRHIGAYELYLKGRGLLYQRGLSIPKAIDCFTQAVALDPLYAQAWAGLADGYTTSGYSGFNRAADVMPRALEAARRALQLDPDLAEAHNAFANATLLYELQFDVAEREFKRALELNPNYPQAHSWYGLFYLHWIAGREREGRNELLQLQRVDPLSGYANVILAFAGLNGDRLSDAVDHARRGVELDPNSYLAQWCLSVALKCNAQYEEAAAVVERALALSGRHCWALATLASIYAAWGKPENARDAFRELESRSTREYIQPSMLIEAAAAVGEIDQAIAFAEQALDDRDPLFVLLARLWPGYDRLRTDSRFLKIVRQLELPGWSVRSDHRSES